MPDNLTTPVADGQILAAKDIAGVKFPWNLLADASGVDAMGLVSATPAANTLLGRLKAILDALTTIDGRVDGLEALATTLNGLVEGLEALGAAQSTATLQGDANATLTAIAGYLDAVETLLAAATPAGENYIGKIGGDVLTAAAGAPAVTTVAYAAGNVIGDKLTFTGAARVAGAAGLVRAATLHSKSVQTGAIDLIVFSADPTGSTTTDHAALVIGAADVAKLVGVIHLTDWSALGAASIAQAVNVGLPFKPQAGTSIFGVLVARAAITLTSTSDLTPTLRIIPG